MPVYDNRIRYESYIGSSCLLSNYGCMESVTAEYPRTKCCYNFGGMMYPPGSCRMVYHTSSNRSYSANTSAYDFPAFTNVFPPGAKVPRRYHQESVWGRDDPWYDEGEHHPVGTERKCNDIRTFPITSVEYPSPTEPNNKHILEDGYLEEYCSMYEDAESFRFYDKLQGKSATLQSTVTSFQSEKRDLGVTFSGLSSDEGISTLSHKKRRRRRNSERRKEKSRDAARCRRGKESEIFSELGELLPLAPPVGTTLDKASVIRVAIAYLRTRNLARSVLHSAKAPDYPDLPKGFVNPEETADDVFLEALDGFLLVLTKEGDIVYTSENISTYLGVAQVDIMGQSLLEYTHPCDHDEVRHMTSLAKGKDSSHCFVRMKCTLTPKGRSVNLKSAGYKVVQLIGQCLNPEESDDCDSKHSMSTLRGESWVVALGAPVPHPSNIEVPLDKQTFVSRHSLDMKFTYVDENVFEFCGYSSDDLLGRSLYELNHALDTQLVHEAYKTLRSKGQVETGRYRFLSHGGGFVWVVTQATLISGHKDTKPQYVVCLNYVISKIECPDVIFSEHQLQCCRARSEVRSEIVDAPGELASPASSRFATASCGSAVDTVAPATSPERQQSRHSPVKSSPVAATRTLLKEKTDDMREGYLIFTDINSQVAVFKKEPEDLTHLAPSGGDDCVPLEVPVYFPELDDLLVESKSQTLNVPSPSKLYSAFPQRGKKRVANPLKFSSTVGSGEDVNKLPFNPASFTKPVAKNPSLNGRLAQPYSGFKNNEKVNAREGSQFFSTGVKEQLSGPSSQKVPEQGISSPLMREGGTPGYRYNTPEPPVSPTPFLSQAASPPTPEQKQNLNSLNQPIPMPATSRLFTELDSPTMDLFNNLDLKLEDDLDLRAPYIPSIDEVLVFGPEDIFLSGSSSGSSNRSNDDCHSRTTDLSERESSPFDISTQYLDSSPSFHHHKTTSDTEGGFVDPNQVLPGQFIKGEEDDSSQELRYLLEVPPPSPVKESVEPPPPLKTRGSSPPRISIKRSLSPLNSHAIFHKRVRSLVCSPGIGKNVYLRKEPNPLLPPPHAPIMQQLLVSKEPIQIRGRTLPSDHSVGSRMGGSGRREPIKGNSSSSCSHSVLRNLLVNGRDDIEGYTVLLSSDNSLSSPSPSSPHSSDGAGINKGDDDSCSAELDSLASIPVNRDGKVELTQEQLRVLLSKAGVLRQPSYSSSSPSCSSTDASPSHFSIASPINSFDSSPHNSSVDSPLSCSPSTSPQNAAEMSSLQNTSSHLCTNIVEKPLFLFDTDFTIPSLVELTSLDYEVNAPAPTPSLLHGADLLMALDQTQ